MHAQLLTAGSRFLTGVIASAAKSSLDPDTEKTICLPLSDGAEGAFESLEWMARAVRGEMPPDYSGYQDEFNRRAAKKIVGSVSGWDQRSVIAALFDFVAHRIKYQPHPFNQQTVQDAKRTIQIGEGDCVSKSVLLATLLASLGYSSRFVAQSENCLDYSHVYVEVWLDGDWLGLDPVAADEPMGWRQRMPNGGCETTWEIFR
jgi:transglutaminase-like putative cysteine protease